MGLMQIPHDDPDMCAKCGISTKGHYIQFEGRRYCLPCISEMGVDALGE